MNFNSLLEHQIGTGLPSPFSVANIDIRDLRSRLSSLIGSLETANVSAGPHFVNIGEGLQRVSEEADHISSETAETARLMNGDSGGTGCHEADLLAYKSLSILQNRQAGILRTLKDVELITDRLSDLDPWSKMLAKIAKRLRAVSIYFAVEGSRSSGFGGTFVGFTQELRQLADTISKIAGNISADSRKLEAKQKAAQIFITDGTSQLQHLSENAEQTADAAFRDAERAVEIAVSALERIGEHSLKLSECVNSIVMAVQFHDITRQEVEHIVSALQDIEKLCYEKGSGGQPDESESALIYGSIYASLRLQVAQMERVILSIREACASIHSGFNEIGAESDAIADSVVQLASGNRSDADVNSPFLAVRGSLQSLGVLLEKSQSLKDRVHDSMVGASEVTRLLSQYVVEVGEINTDLEIKALNATIKSAGNGSEGRGVSVLAQEVVQLSRMCSSFVQTMADRIESISTLALGSGGMEQDTEAVGEETIASELGACVQRVTARYERLLASSSEASAKSEKLRSRIERIEVRLDFLSDLAETFAGHRDQLSAIMEMLSPWADACDGADSILLLHAGRYTMEQEREIHVNALRGVEAIAGSGRHTTAVSCKASVSQADAGEDLGDNVELF